MCSVIVIFGKTIPSYGLLIVLGVLCANLAAFALMRRTGLNRYDLIILEGYGFLCAFLGAKLLFLAVSAGKINWAALSEPAYAKALLQGGFVFYGGLIGGVSGVFAGGRIHGIDAASYLRETVFLIPLAHAFGRTGCFLAGCCYGAAYNGPFAVRYPVGGFAPAAVPLFPVQLLEAVLLLLLSATGLYLQHVRGMRHPARVYAVSYAVIRFFLEYARADAARGSFLAFSTSQWVSIVIFCAVAAKRFLFAKAPVPSLRVPENHV